MNLSPIILTLIFSFSAVFSQQRADYFNTMQPALLDSSNHQLNFYDFADNPAALYNDVHKKSIQMRYYGNFLSGDYRLPFDAETMFDQHYFVRSVQPLSENDIFKGYFAYHKKYDQDVLYSDQSEKLYGSPYLFGDSSKGNFNLNGLYWGGEWAHRFNKNWQSGIAFHYNVDQRIKDIFPKPLNKHLNIHAKYGLQYQIKDLSLAFLYVYTDDQEKVEIKKYSLEQDLTPVMLKFRFSDLPVVERAKTSEERKILNYGHSFGFQLKKEISDFVFMSDYRFSLNDMEIIDGGNDNIAQGTLEQKLHYLNMKLSWKGRQNQSTVSYQLVDKDLTAKHPEFNLETWQAPLKMHQFEYNGKFFIENQLAFYTDASYVYESENRIDNMSVNYWRIQFQKISAKVGLRHNYKNSFQTSVWLGLGKKIDIESEKSDNRYSEYFDYLFTQPFEYYTRKNFTENIGFLIKYKYGPMLDVDIFGTYLNISNKNSFRRQIIFGLNTNVYIF